MQDIKNYTRSELVRAVTAARFSSFNAHQIFNWLYQKTVTDFNAMSNLSKPCRSFLSSMFCADTLTVINRQVSSDGTQKFLLRLADGHAIETVLIPEARRVTVCVSSQVGCKFACTFCASGRAGFVRNLTAGEIVNQLLTVAACAQAAITNVVCMGIGEPLDNLEEVLRALDILTDRQGLAIGKGRICVSTAGPSGGIAAFGLRNPGVKLSVSLHAPTDIVRSKLMPINRSNPLHAVLAEVEEYGCRQKYPVTFEYALIAGVNDSGNDARALAGLAKKMGVKINLIPCNAAGCLRASSGEAIAGFTQILKRAGVFYTVRASRGADIDAACGQLRAAYQACV